MKILQHKLHLTCLALIFAVLSLSLRTNNQRRLSEERREISKVRNLPSNRKIEDGTVFAIINTPKCGTGSMQNSFARSLKCTSKEPTIDRVPILSECKNGGLIARTHYMFAAKDAFDIVRPNPQQQKCVITTAMRNPQTWLPSVFMQSRKDLCDADISYDDFFNEYHSFIMSDSIISRFINVVRPDLLKEFGTNMNSAAEETKRNGGYALYNTFGKKSGTFQNCELLFLDLDAHENWPEIFASLYPGIHYGINQKRIDLCPKVARHYEALLRHVLTKEEIEHVIKGNSDTADYFRAYGM